MDEGFNSLVAHFTKLPIDIHKWNGRLKAATPDAPAPKARLKDNAQQIKAKTPSLVEGFRLSRKNTSVDLAGTDLT